LATTPAPLIQRFVPDDAEQPGSEDAVFAKPGQCPEGFEEGLLGHVLGQGGIADHQVGNTEGDLLMGPDQRLESGDIAILRTQDLLLLVQWAALHRLW
jgi:hypothetical protein